MKLQFFILLLIINTLNVFSEQINVCLQDEQTRKPIIDAAVYLDNDNNQHTGEITPNNGCVQFRIPKGKMTLHVSHLNYKPLSLPLTIISDTIISLSLKPIILEIKEIVVTASESKGISSSSQINKEAMIHLQPSSFSDLMALLPGGISKTPNMTSANIIRLREAGTSDDNYTTSSLGTSFVVDGAPISTDANMQYISQATSSNQDYYRNTTNKGVDMRSISTDDIERVEIIRGIPSVEYGDLTSGLVKIERKLKATPWEARFKADGYGKLFYVGKGVSFNQGNTTLNGGIDYVDAKADPRNNLENYKRITTSIRTQTSFDKTHTKFQWLVNADYTGSIDNDKQDPDLNYMQEDSYRSQYHKISLSNTLTTHFKDTIILKTIQVLGNVSYQVDNIKQTRFIAIDRDRPMPSNQGAGEHNGQYLPYTYVANYEVDGKPLNAFIKSKTNFVFKTGKSFHKSIVGLEWKMDKNYGEGQVYDITRPLFVGTTKRPRTYKKIPAGHQLSFFVEDAIFIPIKEHNLKIVAGLRGTTLLNLSDQYSMDGHIYIDPRMNIQWIFPRILLADKDLIFNISAGIGQHTKMPTLTQLYPDNYYKDIIQLNYYHTNPDYRKLNLMTYEINPTNYDLQPARNLKSEIRLGIQWNRNNFSITYFQENMTSGFRTSTVCIPFVYKKYDTSGINYQTLTSAPMLSDLPYDTKTVLDTYFIYTNGSKITKEGVEFQFSSQRINAIHTRFTINGAWFRTTYVNSQPMFSAQVTKVVNSVSVNDLYIGYYNWNDGSIRELFNTNIIADTYIEKLGLTVSATLQLEWFTSSQTLQRDGVPIAYMDQSGAIFPYTSEDLTDIYKQWLVISYNEGVYRKNSVPFGAYLNFKASKTITKYITIAFFVDKLFDYLPDYKINDVTIRRSVTPYFGMELNLKL